MLFASESFIKCVCDAFFSPPFDYLPALGIGKLHKVHFRCFFLPSFRLFVRFRHRKASRNVNPMLFPPSHRFFLPLWASESFPERKSDAFSAIPPLLSPALGIGKLHKMHFRCFFLKSHSKSIQNPGNKTSETRQKPHIPRQRLYDSVLPLVHPVSINIK